jgi:hypothetical protein
MAMVERYMRLVRFKESCKLNYMIIKV